MSTESAKLDARTPSLGIPIAVSVVLLLSLVVSQSYFRNTFQEHEYDLPFQTELALGIIPPLLLTALLVATVAVNCSKNTRVRTIWKAIVFIVCGGIVGHQVIAMFVAYPTVPPSLTG